MNLVTSAVAAVLLAGCSYTVKDVENPVKMPAAWDAPVSATADATIPREWWKNFNSPVLNDLIERALKDNPTLIAAEERLKRAERDFARQREDLYPDLSLSASTRRTYSGGNQADERTSDSTSVGLSTSNYSVDLFGIQAARYRVNAATFMGTQYDTDLARITLAQNVARAYFNLLGVRSSVNVARENLAIAEDLLRIYEVRFRNGVATEFQFRQQTTQVQQQRTQLIPRENQLRSAETTLGLLLGVTPQEFRIDGEPIENLTVPEIAPWVPSELLLRRPDIAAAEFDMANASANLYIARASLIPVTLSLSASGSTGSQDLFKLSDARTYSVGGVLSLAEGIFAFKQKRTNVLNAESNEYIALVNYAQTIRQALKDVDDTLANAEANARSEELSRETLANSQEALRLANIELREGSGQDQELLEAQRSLYSAQDSLVQARITRLNTAVALFVALGGGWSPPQE